MSLAERIEGIRRYTESVSRAEYLHTVDGNTRYSLSDESVNFITYTRYSDKGGNQNPDSSDNADKPRML